MNLTNQSAVNKQYTFNKFNYLP